MNSFGRLFRIHILGESHGECVGIVIDGCPAGMSLSVGDFEQDMERRKGGSRGTTPRREDDIPLFKSGLFNGNTTGAPLTILFENNNTRSTDYEQLKTQPRPGHADWVAHQKFGGYEDYRGGGHFSGRLTACLVAAGVVAKKIITQAFSEAENNTTQAFSESENNTTQAFSEGENNTAQAFGETENKIKIQATIIEIGGETDLDKGLQKAIDAKDSVGGIVECTITGLPVGLGEPFFDSVESLMSHAVFAIPAIRGIEFGTGFAAAKMFGSQHNDAIINADGNTATNHAGGIVGGIGNGNPMVFRVAVKPTSSTPQTQQTLNTQTGNVEPLAVRGRHDLCIALRVPVVLEAVAAMLLADLLMRCNKIPRILQP